MGGRTGEAESTVDDEVGEQIAEQHRANKLKKQKIIGALLEIILAVLVFISDNVAALIFLVLATLVETFVSPIPVVSFQPLGIMISGEGIRVTTLVQSISTIALMWGAVEMYFTSTPSIEIASTE